MESTIIAFEWNPNQSYPIHTGNSWQKDRGWKDKLNSYGWNCIAIGFCETIDDYANAIQGTLDLYSQIHGHWPSSEFVTALFVSMLTASKRDFETKQINGIDVLIVK